MNCIARAESVIRVVYNAGTGAEDDPHRIEVEYWSFSGRLIARFDINDDPIRE